MNYALKRFFRFWPYLLSGALFLLAAVLLMRAMAGPDIRKGGGVETGLFMETLAMEVESYNLQRGLYPECSDIECLNSELGQSEYRPPVSFNRDHDSGLYDGWGEKVRYFSKDNSQYLLRSCGPDRRCAPSSAQADDLVIENGIWSAAPAELVALDAALDLCLVDDKESGICHLDFTVRNLPEQAADIDFLVIEIFPVDSGAVVSYSEGANVSNREVSWKLGRSRSVSIDLSGPLGKTMIARLVLLDQSFLDTDLTNNFAAPESCNGVSSEIP